MIANMAWNSGCGQINIKSIIYLSYPRVMLKKSLLDLSIELKQNKTFFILNFDISLRGQSNECMGEKR